GGGRGKEHQAGESVAEELADPMASGRGEIFRRAGREDVTSAQGRAPLRRHRPSLTHETVELLPSRARAPHAAVVAMELALTRSPAGHHAAGERVRSLPLRRRGYSTFAAVVP